MITRNLPPLLFTALVAVLVTPPVIADHNSIWGPGKANMPNDIHNTRIEDSATMTPEEWRDFVRQGAGADTVNRYLDEEEAEMLPGQGSMTSRVFGGNVGLGTRR